MTDPLELLRARFIGRCRNDLERIRSLELDHPDLGSIAHQLAGSAGSFGYPETSEAATVVDDGIRPGPGSALEDVQSLMQALETAISAPPSN